MSAHIIKAVEGETVSGQDEGRVTPEEAPQLLTPIAGDDRLQQVAPAMGAVDVARTQSTAFQITEDIEGTSTTDVLNGAGYGDKIYGLSGNDIVSGAAGDGGLYIQNSHGRTLQRNIMYNHV